MLQQWGSGQGNRFWVEIRTLEGCNVIFFLIVIVNRLQTFYLFYRAKRFNKFEDLCHIGFRGAAFMCGKVEDDMIWLPLVDYRTRYLCLLFQFRWGKRC